ncbi:hypothetical protein T484DRAFT_1774413, partial [Baffinella frigidus]
MRVFAGMLTAVALVLLLLDEAETIAPRLRPGSPVVAKEAAGLRGVGKLLRGDAAARRGVGAVGAGAISFEEAKRRNDEIKRCRGVRALAEIVSAYGGRFTHVNVNTAWLKMAELPPGKGDRELAAALQQYTKKLLGKMGGRQLPNLLHSAATLHVSGRPRADNELVQKLASSSQNVLRMNPSSFNSQGVANLMWALGKLGVEVDLGLVKVMQ